MNTIRLLTLTQNALLRHTKQQKNLFITHTKQNKTPIILKSKKKNILQKKKKNHSPDHKKNFYKPTKTSKNNNNILIPPFPLPNIKYPIQYKQNNTPKNKNINKNQQIISQSKLPISSTKLSQNNIKNKTTPIQNNII